MAKLVVRKGRNVGDEHRLIAERMALGRRSAAAVPILDAKASREHALVLQRNGKFFVQDISRNGTYVNDALASKNPDNPTPLNFGDTIRIGDTVLEMVDETQEKFDLDVPGYTLLEKLGAGGMGTVYKARQLSMDRVVALKILNERFSTNKEFVDRFVLEARAAGKLNHPNVIHVHDVAKAGSLNFFSMELVEGLTVKEMLRTQSKLPLRQALDIVVQTAQALEFAHGQGVVHRDVKPDNIMVTREGIVKIADLGIAKSFDKAAADSVGQAVMGTPHYMAPEQAMGKPIDHRVDIYALGATFYHMLTGTTPFSGRTAHQVIKAHLAESLPPLKEYSPELPDDVCFIVERMMAKHPEKRYPNMTRLIEDLHKVLYGAGGGIEPPAPGDSTVTRPVAGKPAPSPPPADAAAPLTSLPTLTPRRTRTEDLRTGPQTPVKAITLVILIVLLFAGAVLGTIFLAPWARARFFPPDNTIGSGEGEQPDGTGKPVPPQIPSAALERLNQAKALLAQDPLSAKAEGLLKELEEKHPTIGEAKELLQGLTARRKERERAEAEAKAKAAFKEAQDFEAQHKDNPAKMQEIAAKYQAAQPLIKDFPDLTQQAQTKQQEWEQRHLRTLADQAKAAYEQAQKDAGQALQAQDFDGARKVWQDFAARFAASQQKGDADAALKAVDEPANKAFQDAQQEAGKKEQEGARPLLSAMKVWDAYLEKVKDAPHRAEAEAARKALADKADKAVQADLAKAGEQGKQFNYGDALTLLAQQADRLPGTKWSEELQARQKDLGLQRDLHDKVVTAIRARVADGPVELPFPVVDPKVPDVKTWAIGNVNATTVYLEMVPRSAVSRPRRWADFQPAEQYKVYRLVLPKPSAEEHKALLAFCRERGLTKEAEEHTDGPPAPPKAEPPKAEPPKGEAPKVEPPKGAPPKPEAPKGVPPEV